MTAGLKFLKWRAAYRGRWNSHMLDLEPQSPVALSNGLFSVASWGRGLLQQIRPSFLSTASCPAAFNGRVSSPSGSRTSVLSG